jgi:integrase
MQGYPSASKTFRLKRDAEDWARQTEGDIRKGLFIDRADSNPQLAWIVELAYETAMRKSEILSLQTGDIDLSKRLARLTMTKNGTSRTVQLTRRAVEILALATANSLRPHETQLVFLGSAAGLAILLTTQLKSSFRRRAHALGLPILSFTICDMKRLVDWSKNDWVI